MTKRRASGKRPRLPGGFHLGGEQAEADPLLRGAFYETGDYRSLVSFDDPRCYVVGRTGSGKTAALRQLEEQDPAHVIRIAPEDLALPYITNLQLIRYLDSIGVQLDPFWIALWKHVLLVEIIRRRYQVNSQREKQNFLGEIKSRILRDPAKVAALEYLDEFEGRFWCETDERVRHIADSFTNRIDREAQGAVNVPAGQGTLRLGRTGEESRSVTVEQTDRFQRIVNETQLARLNKMFSVVNDDILDKGQHHYFIVIDDLDRDWVDEGVSNDLIRCLFRTVLDLKRIEKVKVLVALRTNIFDNLDFGSRSGAQEEKFRALVLEMRWTRVDLVAMLDARVREATAQAGIDTDSVADLFPTPNKKRGDPLDYILDRTLLRPRDALAFANQCLAESAGKTRVSWQDMYDAEKEYSRKRLLALRDEWKGTYPGIDEVFEQFRGCDAPLSREELGSVIDNCFLLLASPNFPGVRWVTEVSDRMWNPGQDQSWEDLYQPMVALLYRIGFLGCRPKDAGRPRFYESDPHFEATPAELKATASFYVHQAYSPTLEMTAKSGR